MHACARWLAACALAAATGAMAQTWPARTVRIIVPFAPGGGVDTISRFLAQKLTEQTGGTFVVENRPGAAGVLACELVARAAPDGHVLLTSAPEFTINPSARSKMPYDALRDFTFISQLTSGQFMLVAHPSVPVRNVKQVIALAKSRPGQLNYGSSGAGGINHLAGELLQMMAGMKWVHIPFKGAGPATTALLGGEVDFVFGSTVGLVSPAKAGKVRPIAVTGTRRYAELPDVQTIAETLPGYDVAGWYGFYGPAGLPAPIVKRLNDEARKGLFSPDIKDKLEKAGNDPVVSSPEQFAAFVRAEIEKWGKVVKAANIKVD